MVGTNREKKKVDQSSMLLLLLLLPVKRLYLYKLNLIHSRASIKSLCGTSKKAFHNN